MGQKGTGLGLDGENLAEIGSSSPNPSFSAALRWEKMRERAQDSQAFCRERGMSGLVGGEGQIRTPETLHDSRGGIQSPVGDSRRRRARTSALHLKIIELQT